MSSLVIFRGLPGAGKSTAAREYAEKTGAILIEPDALCVTEGEYRWTAKRWAAAVELCAATMELLTMGEFDRDGARMRPDIIYADVLPRAEEVQAVIDHVPREYAVTVLTLHGDGKSVHDVRPEDLKRMRAEFEEICFEHGRIVRDDANARTVDTVDEVDPPTRCALWRASKARTADVRRERKGGERDFTAAGHNSRPDRRNAAEGGNGANCGHCGHCGHCAEDGDGAR